MSNGIESDDGPNWGCALVICVFVVSYFTYKIVQHLYPNGVPQ